MRRHTKTESIRIFFLFSSLYSYNGLYFFITSLFWGCVWCRLMVILLKFIGNESCITRKQVNICYYWWISLSRCICLCLREFPAFFWSCILSRRPRGSSCLSWNFLRVSKIFQNDTEKNTKIFHRYIKMTYEIKRRKVFFSNSGKIPRLSI